MGYDCEDGCILSFDGSTPRATLVAYVANEMGCDFTDLSAVVRYARPLSRQEVWDSGGSEGWALMRDLESAPAEPPEDWVLSENASIVQFVDDPNGDYPTQVERVLVVEA